MNTRRWILAAVFILVHIWVLGRLEKLGEYENFLSLSCSRDGITESAFTQWKKSNGSEEFREAVLWKSQGKQEILAESTGHTQQVSCYQMKGQPGALFGKELAEGRYFTEEEKGVCLLDQETARRLYGSDHVQGLKVRLYGCTWRITGILQGQNLICVTSAEDGIRYDGIAVRKKDAGSSSNLAENQIRTVLGSTDGQYVDGKWYVVSARIFYFTMLSIGIVIAGGMVNAEGSRIRKGLSKCSLIFAAGILVWGIATANPGSDYLPSYWSDFAFFERLFQEKIQQMQELLIHQQFSAEQMLLSCWKEVMGAGIFEGIGAGMVTFCRRVCEK